MTSSGPEFERQSLVSDVLVDLAKPPITAAIVMTVPCKGHDARRSYECAQENLTVSS